MTENHVTATDFRKHLAQIANCVAWRHDRCVVTRHGREMVALVSYEDLMFLRKHRPRKEGRPGPQEFAATAMWEWDQVPDPQPQDREPAPREEAAVPQDPANRAEPLSVFASIPPDGPMPHPDQIPLEELRTIVTALEPHGDDLEFDVFGWFALARISLRVRDRAWELQRQKEVDPGRIV